MSEINTVGTVKYGKIRASTRQCINYSKNVYSSTSTELRG